MSRNSAKEKVKEKLGRKIRKHTNCGKATSEHDELGRIIVKEVVCVSSKETEFFKEKKKP